MITLVTNVNDSENITAIWQDSAILTVDVAMQYIRAGEADIDEYVNHAVKPEIETFVNTEIKPELNDYAENVSKNQVNKYVNEFVEPYVEKAENAAETAVNSATNAVNSANSAAASAISAANSASSIEPNKFVRRTGNEDISGQKTFNNEIIVKSTYMLSSRVNTENGVAPDIDIHKYVGLYKKTGGLSYLTALARLHFFLNAQNGTGAELVAARNTEEFSNVFKIGIYTPLEGNPYTYAPTPDVSANNNEMATTKYINNKFKVVSVLPANPNPDIYYGIPEEEV